MSDRLNRKDLKHDKFVEGAEGTIASVRDHARTAIGIAIAAILVIVAVVGYITWSRSREAKAQTSLADAISAFERPLAGENTEGTPAAKTWADEPARLAGTEPMFRGVIAEYGGTDAADVAALYLAQILVREGKPAEALPLYEEFIDDHPGHVLAGPAQMSVYLIRMDSGQRKEVLAELESQLNEDETRLPKDALLAMIAEAYETEGDGAKARDAWQRLANEFPESPYAIDAQRKIAQS